MAFVTAGYAYETITVVIASWADWRPLGCCGDYRDWVRTTKKALVATGVGLGHNNDVMAKG